MNWKMFIFLLLSHLDDIFLFEILTVKRPKNLDNGLFINITNHTYFIK